jgi:hypothetical protein
MQIAAFGKFINRRAIADTVQYQVSGVKQTLNSPVAIEHRNMFTEVQQVTLLDVGRYTVRVALRVNSFRRCNSSIMLPVSRESRSPDQE